MCLGGGDTKKATREAERQERERQAAINRSIDSINQVFNDPSRKRQIDEFTQATRDLLQTQLTQQQRDAERGTRFALARSGLSLGSADADAAAELQRLFNEGLLESERRAQSAGAQLKNADEQSRLSLIGMAQSGLDATTASQQALSQLQANIGLARGEANRQALDDMFRGFADLLRTSQEQDRFRRDQRYGVGGLFGPAVDSTNRFGWAGNIG